MIRGQEERREVAWGQSGKPMLGNGDGSEEEEEGKECTEAERQ